MTRLSVTLMMVALTASAAIAETPLGTAFTYQGQLKNAGSPAIGLHDLRFRLYDASSLGSPIGAFVCLDNVSVTGGLFTVSLDFGAQFAGQERYLEIEVRTDTGLNCANPAGFTVLTPRQALTAAPNALFALNASTAATANTAGNAGLLDGIDSTGFLSLQPSIPGLQQTGNGNISGTLIAEQGVDGRSGTTTPAVRGTTTIADGVGGRFTSMNGYNSVGLFSEAAGAGLFARRGSGSGLTTPGFTGAAITGDGDYQGIVGKTNSVNGGAGVVGNNFAGDALSYFVGTGVSGIAYGANARGVAGSAANLIWGVLGTADWGVTGQRYIDSTHSNYGNLAGAYDGVSGDAGANGGNGVLGVANNGSSAYGVWGRSTSGYAGVFSGTTSVFGNFYATNKFFRIDHPQDPENKYLIHSCVESDEQLNLYRGTAYCNQQGEAWVDLPGYFNALNADPGYQLTCVGGFAQVYVATEAVNRFKIAGGRLGLKVCWTAYGTRQDPYAKAHPMVVEKVKEGEEAGRLLTPTEYGFPVERGMTYEKERKAIEAPRPTSSGIAERTNS